MSPFINTAAFERRCIRSCCVALLAPYLLSTPHSRALPARRIDALGADRMEELRHYLSISGRMMSKLPMTAKMSAIISPLVTFSKRFIVTKEPVRIFSRKGFTEPSLIR